MATLSLPLTTTDWVQVATASTFCVLQAVGSNVVAHAGASAPAPTAAGFDLPAGELIGIPELATLGGNVWVRSLTATGAIKYVSG